MIDVSTVYKVYDCDGSTHEFSFDFKIFDTDDVKVLLYDETNYSSSELTETTDYTVTTTTGNYNDGGKVTTVQDTGDGPENYDYSSDYKIGIFLRRGLTQETDYINGGTVSNSTHENTADHLVLLCQHKKR